MFVDISVAFLFLTLLWAIIVASLVTGYLIGRYTDKDIFRPDSW